MKTKDFIYDERFIWLSGPQIDSFNGEYIAEKYLMVDIHFFRNFSSSHLKVIVPSSVTIPK